MPRSTPLLDELKTGKRKTKGILLPLVDKWLSENPHRLDQWTKDDWETLKDLVMRGARRDSSVFSPSAATSCQRRQVIDKFSQFPQIPITEPRVLKFFDDGRWRHLRWQMVFYKMGIVESMEIFQSEGKLGYGGSYDVMVKMRLPSKKKTRRVVIDIKGTHASSANNIKFTGTPLYSNRVQLVIYMHLNNVDVGILWYENKNNQDIVEVVVERDKKFYKILKKYLRRQEYMKRYVRDKVFPREECDVDERGSEYQRCPQRRNCVCLPVHFVQANGEVVKTHEPRRKSAEKRFRRRNTLPLKKLKGSRGVRALLSKKSKD